MDALALQPIAYLECLGGPLCGEVRRWDGRSTVMVEPTRRRVASGSGTRTTIDWTAPEHHYVLGKTPTGSPVWRHYGQAHG